MAERILIVDDEPDIASTIAFNLEREGFATIVAEDGKSAIAALEADPTSDLVILDLMLPDIAGTEVCRRIRREPATQRVPVIMLTARGEDIDRVVGFEVGADDYVVKPFSMRELMLRVRARLVEAATRLHSPVAATAPQHFSIGPLTIDGETHRVLVDGQEVAVSLLEMQLLVHL